MDLYNGFSKAVEDYAESLVLALILLAIAVILYFPAFMFVGIFASYGFSASFSQTLSSAASGASVGMLVGPRSVINVYRSLLFAVSILSGGVCNWIFIILRAAKDPWWVVGYSIASVILAPLSPLVFVPPISFAAGYTLSSIILEVLPDLVGMVDPAFDALLALVGSVIGGVMGAVVALFGNRSSSCCSED